MKSKRIIIGGGGTGGHVFPAISIANAIMEMHPECEILFVGAENKIEMEKVPEAGYNIIGLPVAGIVRKLSLRNLIFPFRLWKSMRKSKNIIKDFKPDFAIGVGGYASGPILKAASTKGIPIAIQEQNSYAGLTNKLLAKKALKIFVAYQGMEKYFPKEKMVITGNPIRKDILNYHEMTRDAHKGFGLKSSLPTILVIGGSLGARTINESIAGHIEDLGEDVQLIWQTGKYYYEEYKNELDGKVGKNIIILDFIKNMNQAYKSADVIISRAGAGTISELAVVGKPVILVPSPNVAEDHQTKNALALSEKGAAIHVKDSEARDNLIPTAIELLNDKEKQEELSMNLSGLAITDSAQRIVNAIFELI